MNAEGPSYERLRKNWGMARLGRGTGASEKREIAKITNGLLVIVVARGLCKPLGGVQVPYGPQYQ